MPKACAYSCAVSGVENDPDCEQRFRRGLQHQEEVQHVDDQNSGIDYLSFVPGRRAERSTRLGGGSTAFDPLGIPIAVISDGSFLWREDVRQDLLKAMRLATRWTQSMNTGITPWTSPQGATTGQILDAMLAFHDAFQAGVAGDARGRPRRRRGARAPWRTSSVAAS